MRSTKAWLLSTVLVAGLAGGAMMVGTPSASLAQPGPGSHWRHHDGRWSYWHAGDKRWYYTDGSHWFYHNGKSWAPYHFDRLFGREGFERGAYQPPAPGAPIVVPQHGVYIPG